MKWIFYLSKELQQPSNNGQRDSANGQQRRRGSAQSLDRSAHSLDGDGGILLDTSNYSLGSFDSLNNGVGGICPNDTLPSKLVQLSEARKEIIINSIVDRMDNDCECLCLRKIVNFLDTHIKGKFEHSGHMGQCKFTKPSFSFDLHAMNTPDDP